MVRISSALAIGVATVLIGAGACGPCSLTIACESDDAHVVVVGQILDASTGVPVGGVRVSARHVGGPTLRTPISDAVTESTGYFELRATADSVGYPQIELTVSAPGQPPYVVPRILVEAGVKVGAATVLLPWVSTGPGVPFAIRIVDESDGVPVSGATVTFEPTSGPTLRVGGEAIAQLTLVTGDAGIVFLFEIASADTTGDLQGNVIVSQGAQVADTFPVAVAVDPVFRRSHTLLQLVRP